MKLLRKMIHAGPTRKLMLVPGLSIGTTITSAYVPIPVQSRRRGVNQALNFPNLLPIATFPIWQAKVFSSKTKLKRRDCNYRKARFLGHFQFPGILLVDEGNLPLQRHSTRISRLKDKRQPAAADTARPTSTRACSKCLTHDERPSQVLRHSFLPVYFATVARRCYVLIYERNFKLPQAG